MYLLLFLFFPLHFICRQYSLFLNILSVTLPVISTDLLSPLYSLTSTPPHNKSTMYIKEINNRQMTHIGLRIVNLRIFCPLFYYKVHPLFRLFPLFPQAY